jgi:TRAP-type C4-dicarboxylate transport system substrate-binding protein
MIGAKPHAIPFKQSYGYDLIEKGQLDAAETTYLRFLGKYLVKTNHSMFMTVIAMNESFFQGLDSDLQEVVKTAAICASRLEREWSIQDAKKFEEDCAVNGVTITSLSDEDQAHFREQALKVYEKWEPYFMPGMIEHIRLQ